MLTCLKKLTLALLFVTAGLYAQAQTIKGVVRDSEGNTLPGVSVIVDGTAKGTITGADGAYAIDAPLDAVLQYSMIGMKTVYEPSKGRKTVNVTMEADVSFLNEVVVVG